MSVRDEIIRVFRRKVMAHPDGDIVHMGDCNIYNARLGICTCGLHHWLMQAEEGSIDELYPQIMEENTKEGIISYLLRELDNDNLYTKEGEEFVKVEEKKLISDEAVEDAVDKVISILRKKHNYEEDTE
jgi:hypothetical protein